MPMGIRILMPMDISPDARGHRDPDAHGHQDPDAMAISLSLTTPMTLWVSTVIVALFQRLISVVSQTLVTLLLTTEGFTVARPNVAEPNGSEPKGSDLKGSEPEC